MYKCNMCEEVIQYSLIEFEWNGVTYEFCCESCLYEFLNETEIIYSIIDEHCGIVNLMNNYFYYKKE